MSAPVDTASAPESGFAAALLQPDEPVPHGLIAPGGSSVAKRYAIYRNNVMSSLIDAVVDGFPALRAMLGETYLRALAAEFVRAHPPQTPVLSRYGEQLPAFVAAFPPLADMPWLADVATLEWLRRDAQDAEDDSATAADAMTGLDPDSLAARCPRPAHSLRMLSSRWPVVTLWEHALAGERAVCDRDIGESALVVRPLLDVLVYRVPPGVLTFAAGMDGQRTLLTLANMALDADADVDIPETLALLVSSGAMASLEQPSGEGATEASSDQHGASETPSSTPTTEPPSSTPTAR